MPELIIELQTEEMPANYLAFGNRNNQKLFREAFTHGFSQINESGAYSFSDLQIFLTPRRLLFICNGITADIAEREEEVFGPPAERAYDKDGNPTKALEGFAKSKGVQLKDIYRSQNKGRECMACKVRFKPPAFADQIQTLLAVTLGRINFPKLMWWDESGFRFPRPLRGILCLYNDQPVSVGLGKVKSGSETRIFVHGTRIIEQVHSADELFRLYQKHGVIWDQSKRRQLIGSEIKKLAEDLGCEASEQNELLEEVVYLTETPVCLAGTYSKEYAGLPKEVLTSSLSKSQRLFELLKEGAHSEHFIAVLDGQPADNAEVLRNIASILSAKLQDSSHFFREDMKLFADQNVSDRFRDDLKHLVYLKGLGSMYDKTERLAVNSSAILALTGNGNPESKALIAAAKYCKNDLLTQMVGEFPELQGVAGGFYSSASWMGPECGKIIANQYLPTTYGPLIPYQDAETAALVIADKLDLLVACFIAGKTPTASQDPYGLKRNLAATYHICDELNLDLDYRKVFSVIISSFSAFESMFDADRLLDQLVGFHQERLINYIDNRWDNYGKDFIESVLIKECLRPNIAIQRIKKLCSIRNEGFFEDSRVIQERTHNILKGNQEGAKGSVNTDLFEKNIEKELYSALKRIGPEFGDLISRGEYVGATRLYAEAFSDILGQFFEQVLVNVDNPDIRSNRLALLAEVNGLYSIADLSRIVIVRQTADQTSQ